MKIYLLNIILAAALIGVTYWGWSEHQTKNRLQKAIKTKPLTGESKIITKYIDTGGRHHMVIQDAPITEQELKEATAVKPGYVDTLAKALNIAARKITDVTIAKISAEGEAKLYKTLVDSLKRRVLFFQNKYFEASYREGDDSLKYSYHLTLNNVGYSKRSWLLGNTYYYHDIFADDKNVMLNQVNRYTVSDHVPSLSFKLQAKAFYSFSSGQIVPAAGVEIGMKRLYLAGSYFYDQKLNTFRPAIGAKFDIINIQK